MKWTPQKAITVGVGGRRLAGEPERVAGEVGDVLELGQLVVVGEDDRVALGGERAHLGGHRTRPPRREVGRRWGWSVGSSCIPSRPFPMFAGPASASNRANELKPSLLFRMPELPEVEITARRLGAALEGAEVESAPAPGMTR